MKTPVLLVGFNRPDNMEMVFSKIREARPEKLYVAVDGPRQTVPGEEQKCLECQKIVEKVDWPCELHTLFRKVNVGCAEGVSGAVSWAFQSEERLIVLEDDCVPNLSFFTFCDEMLERYKDDTRIWQVCGRSYHPNSSFFKDSDYIFSYYAHIWGWATWKRCWNHFDIRMSDFPDFISVGGAENVFHSKELADFSNKGNQSRYDDIEKVSYHAWDYQWAYAKIKNGALGIIPCKNLIRNIGTESGVHYSNGHNKDTIDIGEMPKVLRHPKFIIENASYDKYHFEHHIHRTFFDRLCRKLKRAMGIQ